MTALILLSEFKKTEIEIWRYVGDYPDYEVSNLGRVRSKRLMNRRSPIRDRGRKRLPFVVMNPNTNRSDCQYPSVSLRRPRNYDEKPHRGRTTVVHRLVAEAFLPNPDNKPFVNHKNGVKTDARVTNLEWSTFDENRQHAMAYGLYPHGETHGCAVLTEDDVRNIRLLATKGMTNRQINQQFQQVKQATIYAVVKNLAWRHVV